MCVSADREPRPATPPHSAPRRPCHPRRTRNPATPSRPWCVAEDGAPRGCRSQRRPRRVILHNGGEQTRVRRLAMRSRPLGPEPTRSAHGHTKGTGTLRSGPSLDGARYRRDAVTASRGNRERRGTADPQRLAVDTGCSGRGRAGSEPGRSARLCFGGEAQRFVDLRSAWTSPRAPETRGPNVPRLHWRGRTLDVTVLDR